MKSALAKEEVCYLFLGTAWFWKFTLFAPSASSNSHPLCLISSSVCMAYVHLIDLLSHPVVHGPALHYVGTCGNVES